MMLLGPHLERGGMQLHEPVGTSPGEGWDAVTLACWDLTWRVVGYSYMMLLGPHLERGGMQLHDAVGTSPGEGWDAVT